MAPTRVTTGDFHDATSFDNRAEAAGVTDLADRLALTSEDRRLESRVIFQMICSSRSGGVPENDRAETARHHGPASPGASEESTYAHAVNIASFLTAQYGLETLDQKIAISELAVEIAQRITEELPGLSASSEAPPG